MDGGGGGDDSLLSHPPLLELSLESRVNISRWRAGNSISGLMRLKRDKAVACNLLNSCKIGIFEISVSYTFRLVVELVVVVVVVVVVVKKLPFEWWGDLLSSARNERAMNKLRRRTWFTCSKFARSVCRFVWKCETRVKLVIVT